jgi:hypothetical protein
MLFAEKRKPFPVLRRTGGTCGGPLNAPIAALLQKFYRYDAWQSGETGIDCPTSTNLEKRTWQATTKRSVAADSITLR